MLRSLGILVEEPTPICGDYMGIIQSSSISKEMIKRMYVTIAYHTVREQVATNVVVP